MTSEEFRNYLVLCVKASGNMIIEMAEDIVGKTGRISDLSIDIDFGPGCLGGMDGIPEITITRSNIPKNETLSELLDAQNSRKI